MAPATLAEKASTTIEAAAAFAAPPLGAASPAGLETGTDMGVVGSAAPSFDGVFFLEEPRRPMVPDATRVARSAQSEPRVRPGARVCKFDKTSNG